jgi:hypothetical protein
MKLLPIALALAPLAAAFPLWPREQLCNANADLCSVKYSEMSFVGTHNSAFVGELDDPRVNQEVSVTQQLDAGIRFLQAQTHEDAFGVLSMCHTSCWLLHAGSLKDYLSQIKGWMDDHPDALVSLLLTNPDSVDINEFGNIFRDVGLNKMAFVPSTSPEPLGINDWPTLGEMIGDGKRLVVFMDFGADQTKVPFIMDEFKYFFETPFSVTDPSAFDSCNIDRPADASADGRMYLVNHVLDKEVLGEDVVVPDYEANFQTNAASGPGSIGHHVDVCKAEYGRLPNVVLLDMFNRGNWLVAQQNMNFPAA